MKDLDLIQRKVEREYQQGFNHVRSERERKRDIMKKILPIDVPEGQVRINLLWKNMQLERALFVSDSLNVKLLASDGVIGKQVQKTAEKVFRYDDEDMDLIHQREDIVDYNALYGVALTVVDNYDDEEHQPISDTINPLSVIPDPRNWRGNKMRFIGFERRVSIDFLKNTDGYINIDKVIDTDTSTDLRLNDQSSDDANGLNTTFEQEGLADIYDHYTTWNGKKILTTWANNKSLLIRHEELEPLTKVERLNPSKITFPVQIHRRKNKPGSFFGVSIADEVLDFQDAISQLANLNLVNARISALGPDKIVDSNLGIDLVQLASKKPGGRYIPSDNVQGNIGNHIYTDNPLQPSQYPMQMIQQLESYAKEITGAGDIAFGNSPQGNQTKAEIQTLMANSNQLLTQVADNYIRGQKEYWKAHYKCYALNMGNKDKKIITLYQKGESLSLEIKKEEFIVDGKVNIFIESQSKVDKENENSSAKLLSLQGVYLPYLTSDYSRNKFLRKIGTSMGIRNFDAETYIPTSVDEDIATMNLELLNRNEDVSPPQPGEDFQTYIDIYKQAMDTPAKEKALMMYQQAKIMMGEQQPQQPQGDEQVKNMAMNQLSNQESNIPNTGQVGI